MAKVNLQKIKDSAAMIAPIASFALPLVDQGLSKSIGVAQTAKSSLGQIESSVNNTLDSAKNASKNNKYHNKLNGFYSEKIASEEENKTDKKEKTTKTLAKIAPYAVGGTLLLAYGAQAAKDKSLTAPMKKAISGVPAEALNQFKKKSDIVKGAVSGAKKGLKEANNITIVQPKKNPLGSFVNGAAWGAGILGAHMLGDAFFKNKTRGVAKSYEKAQPGVVKAVGVAKEVKELVDKYKTEKDNQEKTASIKGAELIDKIKDTVSEKLDKATKKSIDAGINPHKVWKDAVLFPAMTAPLAFAGSEISNKIRQHVKERAKENYLKGYNRRKAKKERDDVGNEKTAGVKNEVKKYIREYGEGGLKSLIKPVAGAIATVPLIYGKEILNQRKITKKIEQRNAEKEKEKQAKGENNHGRDYKGSERNDNSQHNI